MRIKICGIQTPDDAQLCHDAGVDFVGLNFVPGSPRCVSVRQAQTLRPYLEHIQPVGVFQNTPLDTIRGTASVLGLSWVQLHGHISLNTCEQLARDFYVIRALPFNTSLSPEALEALANQVTMFLIDGRQPGSGLPWNWSQCPATNGGFYGKPFLLAGGLDAQNVAKAASQIRPSGVDVASGVQTDGRLDQGKLLDFCHQVGRETPKARAS